MRLKVCSSMKQGRLPQKRARVRASASPSSRNNSLAACGRPAPPGTTSGPPRPQPLNKQSGQRAPQSALCGRALASAAAQAASQPPATASSRAGLAWFHGRPSQHRARRASLLPGESFHSLSRLKSRYTAPSSTLPAATCSRGAPATATAVFSSAAPPRLAAACGQQVLMMRCGVHCKWFSSAENQQEASASSCAVSLGAYQSFAELRHLTVTALRVARS